MIFAGRIPKRALAHRGEKVHAPCCRHQLREPEASIPPQKSQHFLGTIAVETTFSSTLALQGDSFGRAKFRA